MLLRAAAAVLVLTLVAPVSAQEPTPLDVAILTCVGPGFIPDGDPFEVLDSLDERYCKRVCKAATMGCKAVVKAIDKCGVAFLKSSAKISIEVCRGWGYTAQECRGINAEAKADIDWWKAQGRIERDECDREEETLCLGRCGSVASLYDSLIPAPVPERPRPEAGSAIQYLDYANLTPTQPSEPPQGQAGLRIGPSLTESTQEGGGATLTIRALEIGTIGTAQDPERAPLGVREVAEDPTAFLEQ